MGSVVQNTTEHYYPKNIGMAKNSRPKGSDKTQQYQLNIDTVQTPMLKRDVVCHRKFAPPPLTLDNL